MRTAWSPARCVCPASGPDSIVISPCGPAEGAAGGRVGIAMVSATGGGAAGGGAAGGGCHAGIKVVGSPSPLPASAGGGATIVAATSEPFDPCQPGTEGAGTSG